MAQHEPVTRPVDPDDPELHDWARQHSDQLTRDWPELSLGRGSAPADPLALAPAFHAYANSRPNVDWNRCGQAAVATILDFHKVDPWGLPRPDTVHWDSGAAIDAIVADGFGPNFIFGWGTSGNQMADALRHYGLRANAVTMFPSMGGWSATYGILQSYLNLGLPVPVMVDLGRLAGLNYVFHWAVAYHADANNIHLANCPWNPSPTIAQFEAAWRCDFFFVPMDLRFAGVYAIKI